MDPLDEIEEDIKSPKIKYKHAKKRRKISLTLGQKAEILDMLKSGEGSTAVAKALKINESTVRSIKKMEARIRASLAAGVSKCAKVTLFNYTLRKMERSLMAWLSEEEGRGVVVEMVAIQEKAKQFHDQVLDTTPTPSNKDTPFLASKGWFMNFKKRYEQYKRSGGVDSKQALLTDVDPVGSSFLQNSSMEIDDCDRNKKYKVDSSSADCSRLIVDYESADRFTKDFATLIKNRNYKPEQVFNADESKLYWKRMPSKTCLAKRDNVNPGYKAGNDRMTVLLCANATGDFMVKPMVIYRVQNPSGLKDKNKFHLPVFWKTHKRAGITAKLFNEWFHNCFVHDVQRYLVSKDLEFKVLLVLDDALCHPEELQFAHPNIEVMFFPTNTSSYLQPMEQGINSTFKALYTRRILQHLIDVTDAKPSYLNRTWDAYSMSDCIRNIKESLNEMKPSLINVCWRVLWRKCVSSNTLLPTIKNEAKKIAKLGRLVKGDGFEDLQVSDIEEFLESHNTDISDEEYKELVQATSIDNKSKETNACLKSQQMLETLEKGFLLAKQLGDLFFVEDPFMERSINFNKELEEALAPYREMYKILQTKANNMTTFYFPECEPETNFTDTNITSYDLEEHEPFPDSEQQQQCIDISSPYRIKIEQIEPDQADSITLINSQTVAKSESLDWEQHIG